LDPSAVVFRPYELYLRASSSSALREDKRLHRRDSYGRWSRERQRSANTQFQERPKGAVGPLTQQSGEEKSTKFISHSIGELRDHKARGRLIEADDSMPAQSGEIKNSIAQEPKDEKIRKHFSVQSSDG